jgi:NDP-sugar pyrophosphorylase family protein
VPFYSGTAIFEKEAFSSLKEGESAEFVPSVLDPAIRSGKVAFVFSESLWIDIGSPRLWAEAQARLRQALEKKEIPAPIEGRLERADPSWGGRIELGKTSIRMDDIVYEIEDLRNF